ncbi:MULTISPECIES: hypothetical protein [unclassified Bradyrhizobium]|uniref:hypothetical protein n=1 Tax=unclassified Bradyrhizobium TaxID=2631580 RepID=UPI003398BFCA
MRGPLNVSRPPQGRPVFIQAGASDRGRDFAARWAEIIFVTPGLIDVSVEIPQRSARPRGPFRP